MGGEAMITAIDSNCNAACELSRCDWSGEMKKAIAEARVWKRDFSDCHDPAMIMGVGSSDWQGCNGWEKYECPWCVQPDRVYWSWLPEEITLKEELLLEKRLDTTWRHKQKNRYRKHSMANRLHVSKSARG